MVPDMARPKYKRVPSGLECVEEMLCGGEGWATLKVNILQVFIHNRFLRDPVSSHSRGKEKIPRTMVSYH